MFVAHTAPSAGPADLLMLSEFVTFPLFALLVGSGAEIAARRRGAALSAVGALVRGAALLALGWLLTATGPAPVVVVLGQLGVLTVLMWPTSRLPTWAVASVALAAGAVAPATISATRDEALALVMAGDTTGQWWLELVVSTYYPMAVMVLAGCVGILLTRLLVPRGERVGGAARAVAVVLASVVVVAALTTAKLAGRVELVAYQTSWWEEVFVVALAAGVLAACLAVSHVPALRQVLAPVAWSGQMALTLYVAHVVWLIWWARSLFVGTPDDAWANVVGLSLGGLLLASLWRWADLSGPWRRGPLEGVVGVLVLAAQDLAGRVLRAWHRIGRRGAVG